MDFLVCGRCRELEVTYVYVLRHRLDRIRELDDSYEPTCDPDRDTIRGPVDAEGPVLHSDRPLPFVDGCYRASAECALTAGEVSWYTVVPWLRCVRARRQVAAVAELARLLWGPVDERETDRGALRTSHPLLRRIRGWAEDSAGHYERDPELAEAVRCFERGERLRQSPAFCVAWARGFDGVPRGEQLQQARLKGVSKLACRTMKDAAVAAAHSKAEVVLVHAPCAVGAFCRALLTVAPQFCVVLPRGEFVANIGTGRHYGREEAAGSIDCALYVTDAEPAGELMAPTRPGQRTVHVALGDDAEQLAVKWGAQLVLPPAEPCAGWLAALERNVQQHRCNGISRHYTRGVRFHFPESCRCDLEALAAAADLVLDERSKPKFGTEAQTVLAKHDPRTMRRLRRVTFVMCHLVAGPTTPWTWPVNRE